MNTVNFEFKILDNLQPDSMFHSLSNYFQFDDKAMTMLYYNIVCRL